jgi:hypothetical protein
MLGNFWAASQLASSEEGQTAGQPRNPGSIPSRDNLLYSTESIGVLRSTRPPIQRVPGASIPWAKCVGREDDHSCPSTTKVKNVWSYTSTLPYFSTTWCLMKPGVSFFLPGRMQRSWNYRRQKDAVRISTATWALKREGAGIPVNGVLQKMERLRSRKRTQYIK